MCIECKNIFIFDLHDTILEGNEEAIYEILKKLTSESNMDLKVSKDEIKEYMGIPLDKLLKLLYPNLSDDKINLMKERFRNLSDDITPKYLRPIKGVIDLFEFIKKYGDKIFILTSAEEKYAMKMINDAGISKYIDEIKGVKIGYRGNTVDFKTKSLLNIKRIYSEKNLYMIGDKDGDMIAGRNAKITTVYFNPKGENDTDADILITDYINFKMIVYDQ
jgi:phosphoglycolate phosphatase-like HAD superfamily hydrolase